MTEQTYDYIYKTVVSPSIQKVYETIDKRTKEEYHLEIGNLPDYKSNLWTSYNIAKENLKKLYFNVGIDCEKKIDIHKIGACLCYSVLDNRIYKYERKDSPLQLFLLNYLLAFTISVAFIYICTLSDFLKDNDINNYNKLRKQGKFIYPPTHLGHDEYVTGRVKTLALNDFYGNDFDLLTYADMLFWIEWYNIEQLKNVLK